MTCTANTAWIILVVIARNVVVMCVERNEITISLYSVMNVIFHFTLSASTLLSMVFPMMMTGKLVDDEVICKCKVKRKTCKILYCEKSDIFLERMQIIRAAKI